MAVAGMASADDNAVRASLESAKHEDGVNSAGAGYADDLYVRRIVKSVVTCKVCARIGAPVTAESNYKRLFFVYLHIASTSAIICCVEKPLRFIAPEGQATVQAPHP